MSGGDLRDPSSEMGEGNAGSKENGCFSSEGEEFADDTFDQADEEGEKGKDNGSVDAKDEFES